VLDVSTARQKFDHNGEDGPSSLVKEDAVSHVTLDSLSLVSLPQEIKVETNELG